jgi:hypothetical protein
MGSDSIARGRGGLGVVRAKPRADHPPQANREAAALYSPPKPALSQTLGQPANKR